jgi:hypothetical protein
MSKFNEEVAVLTVLLMLYDLYIIMAYIFLCRSYWQNMEGFQGITAAQF